MVNQELTMQADTVISVELQAAEWSQVLAAIDELPRKIAHPIFEKVNSTLMKAAQASMAKQAQSVDAKSEEVIEAPEMEASK